MNVNVLNKNLERVGVVMQYTSLIWDRRYRQNGDCELYLPASMDMINLLQKGFYLTRDDDDMVCVIRKIEITTDAEEGNMLIVTGVDVRCLIDQRVQRQDRPQQFVATRAEAVIRRIVEQAVNEPGNIVGFDDYSNVIYKPDGQKLVSTVENSALTNLVATEYGYMNAGDKIREILASFGWGDRMVLDTTDPADPKLSFEAYKGADRTAEVIFGPSMHSIKSSDYIDDATGMKNVTYYVYRSAKENTWSIPGDENGYYGDATGADRYEQIMDWRNNQSFEMTNAQLQAQYPGGTWQATPAPVSWRSWYYVLPRWEFIVPPGYARVWIEGHPQWDVTFREEGGVTIATATNFILARTIPGEDVETVTDSTRVWLDDLTFSLYLLGMAAEENAKHPEQITFTADVIPDLAYKYKEDYFLGDLVTLQNEFGISATARITEVLESWDANGYSIEIKFNE